MASEFVTGVFEKLRQQVNNMGLDEKSNNKFLMNELKRWCDKEERKNREAENAQREREAETARRTQEAEEARQKLEKAQRQWELELEEAQRQWEFELKLEIKAKTLERAQQDGNRDVASRPLGKVK